MESGQRKRSTRSLKSGIKGGNAVSSLVAIEEKRRAIVTETLRQKLELEKRALQVVERLLDDSVADDILVDCARLITTGNYKDVIEERAIAKLCGYPVCSSKLNNVTRQKYTISTKTNKVYDITERKCFCSNFCYKASKAFELQIPDIPLWLRQHESLPEVILMKRGDGGSAGEEVKLRARRLKEQDIENPLPLVESEAPGDPRRSPLGLSHSDNSEEEADFGSGLVSQRPGPRVHWGELPKKNTGETTLKKFGRASDSRESREERKEEGEGKTEESKESQTGTCMKSVGSQRPTSGARHPSEQPLLLEERGSPEGQSVEEAADLLRHCTLQNREAVTTDPPVQKDTTSAPCRQEGPPEPVPTPHNNCTSASHPLPGLDVTQVGMSRRGAAGLRGLLKTEIRTDFIHINLLEGLRRTFSEWKTEETMRFLYGPDRTSHPPLTEGQVTMEKEEELDEDDLDFVVEATGQGGEPWHQGGAWRPTAPVPDYHTLRKDTGEQELRVKEFYKGTFVLPQNVGCGDSEDQAGKDLSLPLVDSHAQHLIQKRIAIDKLTRSLGVVLGPLRLTMSDVFSDLSSLVRTFRFTNTNIIHKTPEWTLIAVVLLHVLSEVSPEVQKALESPGSIEYLSTLIEELTISAQDMQSLVELLKTPAH